MVSWMWVVWLLAGLVLVGMEVHTQAFYALFLALGAFAATVVALFPTQVWLQAVIGAAVAIVGTLAVRPTLLATLRAPSRAEAGHARCIRQSRRSGSADARTRR